MIRRRRKGNPYLTLVRSDNRITPDDLKLLFEKDLDHASAYWLFAVGAIIGFLTYGLGTLSALGRNALLTNEGSSAFLVVIVAAIGATVFIYVVNWEYVSRIDFRNYIEARAEIGQQPPDQSQHETLPMTSSETGATNTRSQSNAENNIQSERLRYYWDYERSRFTQMLVVLFSALIGAATILNAQVASPIIHLNVFFEDAVIVIVAAYIAYNLTEVIYRFKKAVVKTDEYLKDLNSIPSLRELCGITTDPSADWEELRYWWKRKAVILCAIVVAIFVYLGLTIH